MTLLGAVRGNIRGSVVSSPGNIIFTFVRTGTRLDPDTYTVRLRSAVNGFHDARGVLLDGNGDGTPGDDFTFTFTVDPPAPATVVVGIPDFARGPGQPVDVPAGTGSTPANNDLPLRLSDGSGVTSVSLTLRYDPALLHITGALRGTTRRSAPA